MTFCLNSWYSWYMRRNTGPGRPSPTGLPSRLTMGNTSLEEDVTHNSSAARTSSSVIEIVTRHAPDFMPGTIETRPSREGKYVSLTATVNATSQEQLDALYRELCDHPSVVMVL